MPSEFDSLNAQILWDYHCIQSTKLRTDKRALIIGLGSYDLRVANYCADLLKAGVGNKIIFSGNVGNWTKGKFNQPEAEIFRNVAIAAGVPAKDIWLEITSTNLGENIQFVRKLVEEINYSPSHVILVTKPNTTRRAYAVQQIYWSEIPVIMAAPEISLTNRAPQQSISDIINELVGDTERIIRYPELGYQIYQEVPNNVLKAYLNLRNAGYTSHCMK